MALPVRQVSRRVLTSRSPQAVIGGLVIAVTGAVLGLGWICLAGLVLSAVGEPFLHDRERLVVRALRTVSLGLTARMLLRLAAALTALAGRPASARDVAVLASAAFLLVVCRAGYVFTSARLSARRTPAIETRNMPLKALPVPAPPPRWLLAWSGSAVSAVELFVTVPATLPLPVGSGANLVAFLGALGMLTAAVGCEVAARRTGELLKSEQMIPVAQSQLDELRPEVVLYFGDNKDAVYQVNGWLSTVERLPQRAVVVLRNRGALDRLGPTRLPVLCVPAMLDLMALNLSSVGVALYVANIGNNIHMLRVPGVRSAFIGHGDSDKTASFNPYSRVYSQVWVAGPAGRRRYSDAGVGVDDADVVEVGRPQLDGMSGQLRADDHVPTVLYAPTWEGWDEAQSYSSVVSHGLALAERALAPGSGVRLLYRPHPFTGRRSPEVAAAHERIIAMIVEANQRNNQSEAPTLQVEWPAPLAGVRDRAMRSIISGELDQPTSAVDVEQLRQEAEAEFWSSADPQMHHVVRQSGPSLLSCFGQADILVTDVSSVLSDFVVTGRPYAVCNPLQLSREEFVEMVPSARAGMVLERHSDVGLVLHSARGEHPDGLAAERRELREDLFGLGSTTAQESFERAVRQLGEVASREHETQDQVLVGQAHAR